MRRLAYAAAALALTATLTACGVTADEQDQQPPRQPSIAEQQQAVGAPVSQDYGIRIDKIGVNAQGLQRLGLNADGTIQVPDLADVQRAGVYDRGPLPGEVGPAVVLGHVNGNSQQGVFARLAELREGDTVVANTPRGDVTFKVYRVLVVAKDRFPTSAVYDNTESPELRLLTCGPGAMDSAGANYLNQTIVFAKMVS